MVSGADIGGRIRALRLERGMTQRQLADRSGLSEATVIGRIERGEQVPRLNTAVALARALSVHLNELVVAPGAEVTAPMPSSGAADRLQLERRAQVLVRKLNDARLHHLVGLLEAERSSEA